MIRKFNNTITDFFIRKKIIKKIELENIVQFKQLTLDNMKINN